MRPIREKLARRFDPKSLPRFPIDAMNRIDGTLNREGEGEGRVEGEGEGVKEGEERWGGGRKGGREKKIYTASRPIITA